MTREMPNLDLKQAIPVLYYKKSHKTSFFLY